jgi:hypothetical protein
MTEQETRLECVRLALTLVKDRTGPEGTINANDLAAMAAVILRFVRTEETGVPDAER